MTRPLSRRILLALLTAGLLASAGCGAGGSEPSSSTTSPSATAPSDSSTTVTTAAAALRCDAETFTVDYPRAWSTNGESDGEPCRWFHPEPFDVPDNSEGVGIAIHLRYDALDFDVVTDPDNNSEEVLDRQATEVDGRPAVRMHTRSRGEGLLDKGVESVSWIVDTGRVVFTGATHGVAQGGLEANAPVLDQMMGSLQFTGELDPGDEPR